MRFLNRFLCATFLLLYGFQVQAGLVTSSSRMIYTVGEKEKSLIIANVNQYPIIVQTWVDNGTGDPQQANAPFVVLPVMFRMQPKAIQALRIAYNGDPVAQDRESVFWLNLYEIPGVKKEQNTSVASQGRLDLAMNTQLKIFYRPKSINPPDLHELVQKLKFSVIRQQEKWFIRCQNPTVYHVSFTGVQLIQQDKIFRVRQEMDMMSPPLSEKLYYLEGTEQVETGGQIQFGMVGDDGIIHEGSYDLTTGHIQLKESSKD